jgi:hypothetical protein
MRETPSTQSQLLERFLLQDALYLRGHTASHLYSLVQCRVKCTHQADLEFTMGAWRRRRR